MNANAGNSAAPGTVYTLGYTGRNPAEIASTVDLVGGLLLDIRLSASSRAPQWSGRALERQLGKRYLHVPAMGNVNYRNGGPIQLKDPELGVKVVQRYVEQGIDVVLMCACADWRICHRKVVGDLLAQRLGVRVEHIQHSVNNRQPQRASAVVHQPGLFG